MYNGLLMCLGKEKSKDDFAKSLSTLICINFPYTYGSGAEEVDHVYSRSINNDI